MSIIKIIIFSLLGGAVAYAIYFMRTVLDYSAVEIVQFEDDDYYYYVKAVPKIKISAQVSKIKNIHEVEEESEQEQTEETEDESSYEEDSSTSEDDYEDFEVKIDGIDIEGFVQETEE